MTVTTGWYNEEKTIYYSTIRGDWSIEEFRMHSSQFVKDLAEVTHPVISLVDLRGAKLSIVNVVEAARVTYSEPVSNVELMIMLSASSRWQAVYQSTERLLKRFFPSFHLPLVWVMSEKEAFRRIEQHWRDHHRHGYG